MSVQTLQAEKLNIHLCVKAVKKVRKGNGNTLGTMCCAFGHSSHHATLLT